MEEVRSLGTEAFSCLQEALDLHQPSESELTETLNLSWSQHLHLTDEMPPR